MTKNQKKRAFGYIRVSTALQVEGGYSLDDQENRIRQHAKANDMTLVDIYRDGKSYDNDVAVKAMLQIRDIMLKSEKLKSSAKCLVSLRRKYIIACGTHNGGYINV